MENYEDFERRLRNNHRQESKTDGFCRKIPAWEWVVNPVGSSIESVEQALWKLMD